MEHIPVLATESMNLLHPKEGDIVIDCTTGLGGHSKMLAEIIGESGTLYCLDTDKQNLDDAKKHLANAPCTTHFIHANFKDIQDLNLPQANCIFADLGVSSPHFDDGNRGFSHRIDGPLDLRLNRSTGSTAAELIKQCSEQEVFSILEQYGEIKRPFKLSAQIVQSQPNTTFELKDIIDQVFTYKAKQYYGQVFQALRIAVNDELGALASLLNAVDLLAPDGIMAIISFHSLEDRLVKQQFKTVSTSSIDDYTGASLEDAKYTLLTKKPIIPSAQEIQENPRARSAKLRGIQKKKLP